MPELPDITVYIEALESRLVGQTLERIRIPKPFLLRSVDPPLSAATGKRVGGIRRMGKRIVLELDDDLFLVIHLMIAGRLRWVPAGTKVPGKIGLAAFDFSNGTLILTEAGTKRRASLWLVRGEEGLEQFARGGLEVLDATRDEFAERLQRENHTLKRSLTDPRLFSGVGNAYSDEILHRARLSPIKHTSKLTDDEISTLFDATRDVLLEWTDRLRQEAKGEFPTGVTAFREEMAVHGKFGKPCPVCGTPVQRIRYADNETNYCPRCQTDGRLLADRALSRLLREDWPRSIDEMSWN
ncbi:MAG TPA: DNA-formamidopyrimidine glycosylase family protein [Gemmatimonadaceae bacterium]|jgi:formamidopyrimidine-DNA glycosylase|nr:DNA-formamidopyrimidine glycosylase family protein [Gemmatimonadaceae bacterium]